MSNFTPISECRLCRSTDLMQVIDFGMMPLANGYTQKVEEKEEYYPLTLLNCRRCGHMQIRETVKPEILFSNFLYATSDSPTLVGHFSSYARDVRDMMDSSAFSVLEVASNDGVLLESFEKLQVSRVVGVEPALNLIPLSQARTRAVVIPEFFNEDCAGRILRQHGKFDVVTANNVMAHVADLDGVMRGVAKLLNEDGIFIFENAYLLDTVRNKCYDNTYHEHLQYYGIRPLVGYLKKYDLEFFDVQRQTTQSGSFRGFVKRTGSKKWAVHPRVQERVDEEEASGLYSEKSLLQFRDDFHALYKKLDDIVSNIRSEGKTISCYGCSAKSALLSNKLGLNRRNTRYVVDDAKLKQGLLSPGGKIPIVSRDHFKEQPTDYCIISAWNLGEAIIKRNPEYKGNFILPVPEPRIV